jgi:hypothetical protein
MASATELALEEIAALEHNFIGPTWQRCDDMSWLLPERTLGWEIIGWCARWLRGDEGKPWRFTAEQMRFILWWYAVDENGEFIYRTGVLQRMKGWGKDPLLAVMCLVEFVGPSRVARDKFNDVIWDENGQPVGKPCPRAWVQVTAVNQAQTANTMGMLPSLMSDEFRAQYGIKDGATIIRAHRGRDKLEAVTSSYRAIEGKRTTFTVLNETHHWVAGNKGIQMYETIDGNATKMSSRYLAITNAYLPGEDSVAERMRDTYNKIVDGRAADIGFMYDSLEAHAKTPLTPEALRIVVPIIRGDATWLDPEVVIKSVLNTSIAPSRSRRMWLNQVVAEEDALYSEAEWLPLEDPNAVLVRGDKIVLGFDGGKTDDATGLVAIRLKDNCAFKLGLWERPENWPTGKDAPRWEVPREAVDTAVHDTHRLFDVQGFYADVALWESYISEWSTAYGEGYAVKATEHQPIAWDMRQSQQRVTRAHERLMQRIFDGKLRHDGDMDLRRHVLNARRRTNNYGVSFGKESRESPRKVDLYAALLLAHEAMNDYRSRGKSKESQSTQGWFM